LIGTSRFGGKRRRHLLEGTLEIPWTAGSPSVFKAGDLIFVPAGASHNASNVGKATAEVLET